MLAFNFIMHCHILLRSDLNTSLSLLLKFFASLNPHDKILSIYCINDAAYLIKRNCHLSMAVLHKIKSLQCPIMVCAMALQSRNIQNIPEPWLPSSIGQWLNQQSLKPAKTISF